MTTSFGQDRWYRFSNYYRLPDSPSSEDLNEIEKQQSSRKSRSLLRTCLVVGTVVGVLLLTLLTGCILWMKNRGVSIQPSSYRNISLRKEWRTLSSDEQLHYISAVQCLRTRPSKLGLNQSLYDDFPWVHANVGDYSHESAAFLAWHRYFISTYEKTLQNECGYKGRLPYWDWTLDWKDITNAPVWDATHGFGGTGDPTSPTTLLSGHCVTTGPFANLEVLYAKTKEFKHCLSRGFLDPTDSSTTTTMHELKQWIRPDTIWDILTEPAYEQFNLRLEHNAHVAIPRMIRGDFSIVTAPYDPVFFLHHAQLDRLWFKWQQLRPGRVSEYQGRAAKNVSVRASLTDLLSMAGLAPDVEVAKVMDTTGEELGYAYL